MKNSVCTRDEETKGFCA